MVQFVSLPDDIMTAVCEEANLHNRSVTGQLIHWLKIGQTIEKSRDFDYQRIRDALDGALSPDELTSKEQDFWQAEFMAKMTEPSKQESAFHSSRDLAKNKTP